MRARGDVLQLEVHPTDVGKVVGKGKSSLALEILEAQPKIPSSG